MNATKWTAGPWQIGSDFTTLAGDRKTTLWGSNGNQAVTLIQSGLVKWEEQADANSALIVSAPELYAALELVLPDLEHYVSTHGPGPDARLEVARVALAKARGEEVPMHGAGTTKPR